MVKGSYRSFIKFNEFIALTMFIEKIKHEKLKKRTGHAPFLSLNDQFFTFVLKKSQKETLLK